MDKSTIIKIISLVSFYILYIFLKKILLKKNIKNENSEKNTPLEKNFSVKYPLKIKLFFLVCSFLFMMPSIFGYSKEGPIILVSLVFPISSFVLFLNTAILKIDVKENEIHIRTILIGKKKLSYDEIRVIDRITGFRIYHKGRYLCEVSFLLDYNENLKDILYKKSKVELFLGRKYHTKEELKKLKKFKKS